MRAASRLERHRHQCRRNGNEARPAAESGAQGADDLRHGQRTGIRRDIGLAGGRRLGEGEMNRSDEVLARQHRTPIVQCAEGERPR
jgi:hypothetical protein